MSVNKLKLNPTKTEFFIAGTHQGLKTLPHDVAFRLGDDTIKPSTTVRILGMKFDAHMTMTPHINSLISSVNYHIIIVWCEGKRLGSLTITSKQSR